MREIDGVELEKRREGDRRSGGRSTVREESSKRSDFLIFNAAQKLPRFRFTVFHRPRNANLPPLLLGRGHFRQPPRREAPARGNRAH